MFQKLIRYLNNIIKCIEKIKEEVLTISSVCSMYADYMHVLVKCRLGDLALDTRSIGL